MKRDLIELSERYTSALRKHLKQSARASSRSARALGRQALSLGLGTLDVARMHEGALSELAASSGKEGIVEQADLFFSEAITPIEETHGAALKASVRLSQLNKTLDRRTVDVAAANRSLKEGIAQRKTAEKALKISGEHSKKLLNESRRLQKTLRDLTHQILSAHEDKRKRLSHELQDEIAQTLLGMNVRLLGLKQQATANAEGLRKEIASTRRLVDKSMQSIKSFAREFGKHHEP